MDQEILRPGSLESSFIEIIFPKETSIVVAYINIQVWKLAISMKTFSHLLDKMLKEENTCLLMGDFNVNLLNNDNKSEISEFFCPIYPSANRDKQKILKVLLIICF